MVSSVWFGEKSVVLPGSPQEGSGQTPRASPLSLDEGFLPGFLGHVSVGGIVGCFVGEGKILVAGRLL